MVMDSLDVGNLGMCGGVFVQRWNDPLKHQRPKQKARAPLPNMQLSWLSRTSRHERLHPMHASLL
eukprot:4196535-Amphidinium_carterae.1